MTKAQKYLLYITFLLVPLVFANTFSNFFDMPKILVLSLGLMLTLLIFSLRVISVGRVSLGVSSLDFPLLLLMVSYFLSAVIRTPNKMDAFLFPGSATVIIASVLFYFLLNLTGLGRDKKGLAVTLFTSGTLVSVVYLLSASGIFARIPQLPQFVKDASFSPLGGLLPQTVFLFVLLPLGISLVVKEVDAVKKLFYGISLLVSGLAIALSVYSLLPGKPTTPVLPPSQTSWVVAVESLKTSPLFGMGPGNYLTAFSRFKPLSYNATNLWAVRFSTANNFPLTLLAEAGLLAFAALLLIYWKVISDLRGKISLDFSFESASVLSLSLMLIALILFPANTPLILLFAALLALKTSVHEVTIPLSGESLNSRLPATIVSLPVIALVIFLGYWGGRVYLAEYHYRQALNKIIANDGRGAYDAMREAIRLNPQVDRYHSSYAQVNLALARSIAQKQDLNENERNTVAQLVQQAIREGRASVTLNPQRAGNWELLARTYQAIMAFATGADQFAITAFSQAVALDPVNPNLRIALGGVHFALGRFDEAIRSFELAVVAKPDLANAHYNLGIGYREKGDFDRAIEQINLVLSLVSKDSRDYEVAKAELDNLETKKKEVAESGETLTPPQSAEKPVIQPPLTLPQEATPPATPQ